VLAQKYFHRAGVPARLKRIEEDAVPAREIVRPVILSNPAKSAKKASQMIQSG